MSKTQIHIDQLGRKVETPLQPQRIISLVPSQTELLFDLELGERVVGITKFCIHPKKWFRTKARIGGTKKLDFEQISALNSDLIIANKEENNKKDIERLAKDFPVWVSDVNNLNYALEMIQLVGGITNTNASELILKIETEFQRLKPIVPSKKNAISHMEKPLHVCRLRHVYP
ncbi:helical backbone metal receptor [Flavobacteriales bacterium]|nr:helical backbone metal receptor [Flavobacteriales bacterium]